MANDHFSSLPNEINQLIVLNLQCRDVFTLRVTSRKFLNIVDDDVLWRQILHAQKHVLPGIESFVDPNTSSNTQLRKIIRRALRLKANWHSKTPVAYGINRIPHVGSNRSFDDLRLLPGAKILMGVRRSRTGERPSATVSVFSLADVSDATFVSTFALQGYVSYFDVDLLVKDCTMVVFAASVRDGNDTSAMEVHSSMLPSTSASTRTQKTLHEIPFRLDLTNEIIHGISIKGDVAVFGVLNNDPEMWDDISTNKYIVVNWKTGYFRAIRPSILQTAPSIVLRSELKITCKQLLHAIVTSGKLFVMTCSLTSIFSDPLKAPTSLQDIYTVPFAQMSMPMTNIYPLVNTHIQLAYSFNKISQTLESISLIAFVLGTGAGQPEGVHFCVRFANGDPLNIGLPETARDETFGLHPESNVMFAKLGTTGCRAVWIEKDLESDDERLMKLSFGSGSSSSDISVLLPPEPGLPFKPRECRSIAFDDVTGRLCVGLYNGEIYVLDYS